MCCWRHKWTEWKTYSWTGTSYGSRFGGDTTGRLVTMTKQARQCQHCKIEQHRVVEDGHGSIFADIGKETMTAPPKPENATKA